MLKNKHTLPIIIFLLVALALNKSFFAGIKADEILYIADQFFKFSYQEILSDAFFSRRYDSLGISNGYTLILGFWDVLYMLAAYGIGSSLGLLVVEKTLFFLVIVTSLIISYIGFHKIGTLYASVTSIPSIVSITLWYCLNPYALILWHGGVYNLTAALTYALFPLSFFYFNITMFHKPNLRNLLITAVIFSLMAFNFWLFASVVIFFLTYSLVLLVVRANKIKTLKYLLLNSIVLVLFCVALSSFTAINSFEQFSTRANNNNAVLSRNFENLQGGLTNPIMLRLSWGMYTLWVPRTSYSFAEHFYSKSYNVVTISLYALVLTGICSIIFQHFKRKSNELEKIKIIVGIAVAFMLAIFFAKGAQAPYGEIFTYLYENISFFKVFKSPEVRFGFTIVGSIAIMLAMVSNRVNKIILTGILLIILVVQSKYLLNGTAIRGTSAQGKFYDRVVKLSEDQKSLIKFFENEEKAHTYILPIPTTEYGHFVFDNEDRYIGPDLVMKHIELPILYPSSYGGISTKTYENLTEALTNKDLSKIENFPIKYLVLRKDVICNDCRMFTEEEISNNNELTEIFKNDTYKVYEFNNHSNIIMATNDIKVSSITSSPVKTEVRLEEIKNNTTLEYLVSFNENWKIYPKVASNNNSIKEDGKHLLHTTLFQPIELTYLFKKPLFENKHTLSRNYANSWEISKEELEQTLPSEYYSYNEDGSINLELIIYFESQEKLYISALISSLGFVIATILIYKLGKVQNGYS